jgi:hypothetical protein
LQEQQEPTEIPEAERQFRDDGQGPIHWIVHEPCGRCREIHIERQSDGRTNSQKREYDTAVLLRLLNDLSSAKDKSEEEQAEIPGTDPVQRTCRRRCSEQLLTWEYLDPCADHI